MSDIVWWTGFAVWVAFASVVLWAVLCSLANVFDATWFSVRCVVEGGTTNFSAKNLARIWWAAFMRQLDSVGTTRGYRIVFPGYGRNEADD